MEEEKKKWYHIPYKAQFLSRPIPFQVATVISPDNPTSLRIHPLVNPSKNSIKGVAAK